MFSLRQINGNNMEKIDVEIISNSPQPKIKGLLNDSLQVAL